MGAYLIFLLLFLGVVLVHNVVEISSLYSVLGEFWKQSVSLCSVLVFTLK